jgi:methylmalonyl-CoA mutase cobalamin-binding subunit
MTTEAEVYKPKNDVRVVTATSLFDGHDAAINIMRRILQDTGVEHRRRSDSLRAQSIGTGNRGCCY